MITLQALTGRLVDFLHRLPACLPHVGRRAGLLRAAPAAPAVDGRPPRPRPLPLLRRRRLPRQLPPRQTLLRHGPLLRRPGSHNR